jgi:hypothetical protein
MQRERERLTDMTELTVASHNFENVPKNEFKRYATNIL